MALTSPIYRTSRSWEKVALCQGEILTGLIQAHLNLPALAAGDQVVDYKVHPYAVVLTQDCDLEQDFRSRTGQLKTDKTIPNVLFCEAATAEELHEPSTGMTSRIWERVKINKDERYHFLQRVPDWHDPQGEGLPELGIDFKRYFTLPTAEVYHRLEQKGCLRRCVLLSPYLEHLSSRFAYYLSRVGLPLDHASE